MLSSSLGTTQCADELPRGISVDREVNSDPAFSLMGTLNPHASPFVIHLRDMSEIHPLPVSLPVWDIGLYSRRIS